MKGLVSALKAIYEFFAGDWVILTSTAVAFGASIVLVEVVHAPRWAAAAALIILTIGGLLAALLREVGSNT